MVHTVEVKHLTKSYGKSRGIVDVSFEIHEGEIFGFIGPNGAGKSTTIRTLLALLRPTSGNASIFGMDCIQRAPEIAKRVGYLPSEVFYYDGMRVRDLLSYAAGFYHKDCRRKISDLSERMDLDVNKKIEDLSFGNKKKVGIIQGLLHEPDLIILDEPTLGLDPLMQKTFFELIHEENQRGASILMSSHILSEVQKICGRVALIKEGRILAVDTISALKEKNVRRFAFETKESIPIDRFQIEGIRDMEVKDRSFEFIYRGDVNRIMKLVAKIDLDSITISEPDLEEIFLHFYTKEA